MLSILTYHDTNLSCFLFSLLLDHLLEFLFVCPALKCLCLPARSLTLFIPYMFLLGYSPPTILISRSLLRSSRPMFPSSCLPEFFTHKHLTCKHLKSNSWSSIQTHFSSRNFCLSKCPTTHWIIQHNLEASPHPLLLVNYPAHPFSLFPCSRFRTWLFLSWITAKASPFFFVIYFPICNQKCFFLNIIRVPIVAQQVKNLTNVDEDAGLIPGLAHWVKDLALPQLWCR